MGDERLIADVTAVEIVDGPHNVGRTHVVEVNEALLSFPGGEAPDPIGPTAPAGEM